MIQDFYVVIGNYYFFYIQLTIVTDIHEIMLMKKRLHEYIVNCLIASGYDEMQVLCDMDTNETLKMPLK